MEEEDDDDEEEEGSCLPTIYFSHTVEPKKVRLRPKNWTQALVFAFNSSIFAASLLPLQVRINTGKNTTLKFSERKEQKEHSKKKKKNGHANGHAHGHAHHDFHKITTPADIYR